MLVRVSHSHKVSRQIMSSYSQKPKPEQAICCQCGLVSATHHICQVNFGEKKSLQLCDACESKRITLTGFPRMELRGARCFYCGDLASSGSINQSWESSRGHIFHYTCSQCFQNYHDLLLPELAKLEGDTGPEQQLEQMTQLAIKIDYEVRAMAGQTSD